MVPLHHGTVHSHSTAAAPVQRQRCDGASHLCWHIHARTYYRIHAHPLHTTSAHRHPCICDLLLLLPFSLLISPSPCHGHSLAWLRRLRSSRCCSCSHPLSPPTRATPTVATTTAARAIIARMLAMAHRHPLAHIVSPCRSAAPSTPHRIAGALHRLDRTACTHSPPTSLPPLRCPAVRLAVCRCDYYYNGSQPSQTHVSSPAARAQHSPALLSPLCVVTLMP